MTDPRRRNLIVLGSAALVSLALAAVALEQRAAQGTPDYKPAAVLPGFTAKAANAAQIDIMGAGGTFRVVQAPGGWVLPERNNYPAEFEQVRRSLIGLASLQTIAPKTSRADWLHYLSLDAPPKGAGTRVTVKDAKGAVLADLIVGHTEDLGDPNGTTGVFVRRPDENQSWLARASFVPPADVAAWLSARVLDMAPMRLKDVTVTPATGPAYSIAHATASAPYELKPAPKAGIPNTRMIGDIAFAIYSFSFADVRSEAGLDFSRPTRVMAHSFDGLSVTLDLIRQGADIWVRLSAAADAPAVSQEAQEINDRARGWAYKLPPQKARALMGDYASLIMPPRQFPGMAGAPLPGAAP